MLRLNHVGDWGTQFGMLIMHLRDEAPEALRGEATLYDAAQLDLMPWRHDARIPTTRAVPPPTAFPTAWPSGVEPPTCEADVLETWAFERACDTLDALDEWHRSSMDAASPSARPRGRVFGLAAVRPAWRSFFAAGGAIDFSSSPPRPHGEGHAFDTHVNAKAAAAIFAGAPDQAAARLWDFGVQMHAPDWFESADGTVRDTPVLALAPNLLSTYPSAAGPVGRQLADFAARGWTRRAAHRRDRAAGRIGAPSLRFLSAPIGGVEKRGTPEPRVITSLGWPNDPMPFELPPGGDGPAAIYRSLNETSGDSVSSRAAENAYFYHESKGSIAEQVQNSCIIGLGCAVDGLFVF